MEHTFTHEVWGLHSDPAWRRAVKDILASFPVTSIVETGTFFGSSTAFFETVFEGQIYSCDLHEGATIVAKAFFKDKDRVHISNESSPTFLKNLIGDDVLGDLPLIFLDAHLGLEAPLLEELAILGFLDKAIIMIDDEKSFPPGISGHAVYPQKPLNPHLIIFKGLEPIGLEDYA